MALDMADVLRNADILLVQDDQFRAFNLLERQDQFVDNPAIGLDIASMIRCGLEIDQIEHLVIDYLLSFHVHLTHIQLQMRDGHVAFSLVCGGSHV